MKFGGGKNDTARSGEITGFFGEGVEFIGDLKFKDTIRLDGRLTGKVQSDGELVIGPTGSVDGEISVGSLGVSGRLKGTIRVKERIEIHPGGRVEGEILLGKPGLVVHDGGVLEAKIQMGGGPEPAPARRMDAKPAAVGGSV